MRKTQNQRLSVFIFAHFVICCHHSTIDNHQHLKLQRKPPPLHPSYPTTSNPIPIGGGGGGGAGRWGEGGGSGPPTHTTTTTLWRSVWGGVVHNQPIANQPTGTSSTHTSTHTHTRTLLLQVVAVGVWFSFLQDFSYNVKNAHGATFYMLNGALTYALLRDLDI